MNDLKSKIQSAELKLCALGKVASGLEQELEMLKKKTANPVPACRTTKKQKRIAVIAEFYMKRKINGAKKTY